MNFFYNGTTWEKTAQATLRFSPICCNALQLNSFLMLH